MLSTKRAAFSSNCKYFACYNIDDKLLVWETINNVFIDCNFDSRIYNTCSSLHWMPLRRKPPSLKKAKLSNKTHSSENQLLAVGTAKGDILLYDVSSANLFLHLVGRHSGAVNDMCYHTETDSFFTCSSDKSIAVWDIFSGKQKSKWKAGEDPVSSICVLNEDNLLSSSTSIILWNISEKVAIKKFSGHSTEIFKLLPVNAVSLNSCYFLSAAVNDVKINAWSLNSNESETPVASFIIPEQLDDLDISKVSSKDKPLVLSAVTKDGFLHLFEHVLNGNVNQPIHPKVSLKVAPKSPNSSILSLKLSSQSESCVVASGSSKDNIIFKHINIKESLQGAAAKHKISINKSRDRSPVVSETNLTEKKSVPINGLKSPSKCSENNKKKTQHESVVGSYRRKLRSSACLGLPANDSDSQNFSETDDSKSFQKDRNHIKVNMKNPKSCIDLLLKGLKTKNEDSIDAVFQISDAELIRECAENVSPSSLKLVLNEINQRLCHNQSYSPTLSKWLKEISKVHLSNIIKCEDTRQVLQHINRHLDSLKIHETITKMSALQGLLSLTTQLSSSDDSNSDSDDCMEL